MHACVSRTCRYFGFGWCDLEATSDIADDEWTSLAMVFDDKVGKRIYINGMLDAEDHTDRRLLNCHSGQLTLGKVTHCDGLVGELCGLQCLKCALPEAALREMLARSKPTDDAPGVGEVVDVFSSLPNLAPAHYRRCLDALRHHGDDEHVCREVAGALRRLPTEQLIASGVVAALLELLGSVGAQRATGAGGAPLALRLGPLRIIAARYGFASDVWEPTSLAAADKKPAEANDCTATVQGLVADEEVHINTKRERQYMNDTMWPDAPPVPIPRKLSVRFAYGSNEPLEITTAAVPFETVPLVITRWGTSPPSVLGDADAYGVLQAAAAVLHELPSLPPEDAAAAVALLRSPSSFVQSTALSLLRTLDQPTLATHAGAIGQLAHELGACGQEAAMLALKLVTAVEVKA